MSEPPARSLPGADQKDTSPPSVPSLSVSMSNIPPTVPDHTVVCRIGGGSYGEVWLAPSVLGELRAVKVISRSRFNDDRPFEREFAGIQRFEPISRSHPCQLVILHVGKNDDAGCFYYVVELPRQARSSADFRMRADWSLAYHGPRASAPARSRPPRATSNAVYHRSNDLLANKDSIGNVCHPQRA